MRCFTACSGSWKCKKTIKRTHLQDQCLSPRDEINEAVKQLAAAATKSRKQDQIIDSIQFISESNEEQHNSIKRKKNTFDDSNRMDNLLENENMKAEKKSKECNDEGLDSNANHQDLSIENNKKVSTNLDSNCGIVKECSVLLQQESSESLFSLSIDSRRQMYGVDIGGDKEVSSVLKENISTVSNEIDKVNKNPSKYEEDKENEEPILKQQPVEEKSKRTTMKLVDNHEISVDTTSLSSWLVVSDKLDESSSSPSCSVDGGIGTVGSYLQHTDQALAG